ncbi:hypothetical protein MUK72_19815 (plasmid) [Halococcus dombrowskii]|uniref:Uncharacterized protein n=1 Tax=Halococcus dombrowskii TaxID=179637 RepID=A0AAX3AU02_HALDO|nr:hypothetical protein [Halococcus dombrowskii]UOO97389.1 hypothetical protein MUK72_19815 [Halococcus dombrowskii]
MNDSESTVVCVGWLGRFEPWIGKRVVLDISFFECGVRDGVIGFPVGERLVEVLFKDDSNDLGVGWILGVILSDGLVQSGNIPLISGSTGGIDDDSGIGVVVFTIADDVSVVPVGFWIGHTEVLMGGSNKR